MTCRIIVIFILFIQLINFVELAFSPLKYCSFDNNEYISDRTIPDRVKSNPTMDIRVKQVHVLHRHGSRAPDSPTSVSCLPSLEDNPIKWDCTYNDIILGDSTTSKSISESNSMKLSNSSSSNDDKETPTKPIEHNKSMPIFFEKKYDANIDRNDLHGNCMLGQLTPDAIPQMKHIANSIHSGFFRDDPLFTIKDFQSNPSVLYFRSTDKQRTINSGSLIISQLLNNLLSDDPDYIQNPTSIPPLDLHMVELSNDELRINNITCPDHGSILKRLLNSTEAKLLYQKNKSFYEKWSAISNLEFKSFYKSHILDCYTSVLCSGNQQYLPEFMRVNETNYEDSFATLFYKAYSEEYEFVYNWNDSELAKCTARDFIKTFFGAFDAGSENTLEFSSSRESKLLIYSAHDTTLIFFMSALEKIFDGMWPPLASMLLFELSEDSRGSHYFRVIYNGNDITHKWKGCNQSTIFNDEGVCPFRYIIDQIQWIHSYPKIELEIQTLDKSNNILYISLLIGLGCTFSAVYFILRSFIRLIPSDTNEKLHLLRELREFSQSTTPK